MKDVRIVIVSWNVATLLERCLASLEAACEGLDWECVIVDNASQDATVKIAQQLAQASQGHLRVIASLTNRGFAAGCNMGAQNADARYVLFLNPDTECTPQSITKLVRAGDARPEAGILGPKLIYPDGRTQESVRRFPTVADQAGILLKLHHLFPRLPLFRSYFARDLSPDAEQDVDQVMGACLLIRLEVFKRAGGFDERYFIWFEEVDLCKTVKLQGWSVRYVPSVRIVHHGGQSFAQVFSVKKQRYFSTSLRAYFAKWHPGWRAQAIRILAPISLAIAWLATTPEGRWAAAVLVLELTSLATIFTSLPNTIAVCIVTMLVGWLAWKRPTIALGALLLELLIGSKGYLLQFGGWPSTISLRILITMAFCVGWFWNFWREGSVWNVVGLVHRRRGYLILLLMIAYATLRGILQGNVQALKDANAWMDWILFFPVLDISWRYRAHIRRDVTPVFAVAIVWMAVKMMLLEYVFSHGIRFASQPLYLWVRRTGVGEVTLVTVNAFRIFLQSSIYAVPALFASIAWWCASEAEKRPAKKSVWHEPVFWLIAACTMILGLGLSRSFWIGCLAGGLVLGGGLWKCGVLTWHRIRLPIGAKLAGLCAIAAVLALPLPPVKMASLTELFGSRAQAQEAAVESRWNLLPVLWRKIQEYPISGSGFGATVTYQSRDPRILAEHPDGMYTTYAFEWGWLEQWIKFGVLGIPLLAYLLVSLGWRLWKSTEPFWVRIAAVASVVGLAVIHMFTPYLNHPLGFVFFFVGEGMLISAALPARQPLSARTEAGEDDTMFA